MARFTSKHCTAWLKGLSGEQSVELGPGDGALSISNLMEGNRETVTVINHGRLDGRVYGDEVEQEWSLTLQLRNQAIVSATEARVLNAILKTGLFADAQTTDPGGQVWAPYLLVRLLDEVGNVEWIRLPSVRVSAELGIAAEGATLSLSGSNIGTVLWGADATAETGA